MSNGNSIIHTTITNIMQELDDADGPDNCDLARALKRATKLSLVIGDQTLRLLRINLCMIGVVLVTATRVDGKTILDVVFKVFIQ